MLQLLVYIFFSKRIYTDEKKLFSKVYKYPAGIMLIFDIYKIILPLICLILAFVFFILTFVFLILALYFLILGLSSYFFITCFFVLLFSILPTIILHSKSTERIEKLVTSIRKFYTLNKNKALTKNDWKKIKKTAPKLYEDLLSEKCNHYCYYYSLEIAKLITDTTLIWCGVKSPFDFNTTYYAHAVILKNGYIYDSNLRESVKYEDYVKLYSLKLYKYFEYSDYSKKDFVENERMKFRNWCNKNNVEGYMNF